MSNKIKHRYIIPMAGNGQRFIDEGYIGPKHLIKYKNRDLLDLSIDSLDLNESELIFIIREDHNQRFLLREILKKKYGNDIKVITTEDVTQGSLCTCLLAKKYINDDIPISIYTLDVQFKGRFNPSIISKELDGFILGFKANSKNYSYLKVDNNKYVTETAEKTVISPYAAVGLYYFKSGKIFIETAEEAINQKYMTNGEYYICPIYNLMINKNLKVRMDEVQKMYIFGTPKEFNLFKSHVIDYKSNEKPIALCSDHSGFEIKEMVKIVLEKNKLDYVDYGCSINKACDYPDYVIPAANSITSKEAVFGIGSCMTGQGINMTANGEKNIRSTIVFDEFTAEYAVRHNAANFFSLPARYVDSEIVEKIINTIINNTFDGGRHQNRLEKLFK